MIHTLFFHFAHCPSWGGFKVIMTNDDNTYATEFNALKAAGVQVVTYKDSSSILYIHAKVILADFGFSGAQKLFIGSLQFWNSMVQHVRDPKCR